MDIQMDTEIGGWIVDLSVDCSDLFIGMTHSFFFFFWYPHYLTPSRCSATFVN